MERRKNIRLQQYDYSAAGCYFITICTRNRENRFWRVETKTAGLPNDAVVGARIARPDCPDYSLSAYGIIADAAIRSIHDHYPAVLVENYVVMSNHIHLLLTISSDENGRAMRAPTISVVVNQLKGYISKQVGEPIWQKLFHDHIIRDEADYQKHWQYIEDNPAKWSEDEYYLEEQCYGSKI